MTPLITLTVAWLLGIIIAHWLEPPPVMLALLAVPGLGGLLLYRQEPRPRFLALSALLALLGAARFVLAVPKIDAGHVAFYTNTGPVTLTARIIDEPDRRDQRTDLHLRVETLTGEDGQIRTVRGLVLLQGPRYPEYQYGDTLSVSGELETPPIFEDFSYRDYLARQGIYTLIRRPSVTLLAEQAGFSLKASIFRLKTRAHQVINRSLPEPQAALLSGILLGVESGIPKELYQDFSATGASHVIVISGSNIALVMGILLLVGQKIIGKRKATGLAVVGVILYTIMVGAEASVTRAAIMGLIYVGAIYFGRENDALNALFITAFLMTLANPLTFWDPGFQLSFLATLGLIVLVPSLEQGAEIFLGRFSPSGRAYSLISLLNEALLVTIAAQVMTMPILLYQFKRFSIVSLLTNMLIVPVQPLIMLFGGLATMAGLIFQPLGAILGWLAWLPLAWTIAVVRWTARFSWSQLELPGPPLWLLALTYLTLGAAIWWLRRPVETRVQTILNQNGLRKSTSVTFGGLVLLAILAWSATRNLPDGKLHVAFLDVGQGDAILVTTPNGRQILIDGGPSPTQLGQRLGEEMPFWDRSLDMVINTHPDLDHLGGLVEILKRYEVETILVSDVAANSSFYQAWRNQLEVAQQQPLPAWQGLALQLDEGVQAHILNPGPASVSAELPNDHSVVLKLSMGEISFLLTGDIEAGVEQALAASDLDLQAVVLKSPHHGSKTSSDPGFLDQVNPQIVLISAGQDNQFGHPHQEILQRYTERDFTVFRTDQAGTVEFITNGRQVWVETQRLSAPGAR